MFKLIRKSIILSFIFSMTFCLSCFAQESASSTGSDGRSKIIDVPIEKDYISLKFTLNFEYFDDYSVNIYSPGNKNVFTPTKISELQMECITDMSEKGVWKIEINKPSAEKTTSTDEITVIQDNETNEVIENTNSVTEVSLREISPVKVQVEGSTEKIMDVNKDITVSEDIAGLKTYFKDDNLEVEWSSTFSGDVHIEVINPENMEKLADDRIQGTSFELPIPLDIKEIILTIAPSTDISNEGSVKSYSLIVDNHPNATVHFEDLSITNKDTIKCTIINNDTYGAKFLVNNREVSNIDIQPSGEYEYDIPIDVGVNNITAYIVDKNGNMRSSTWTVEKDVVAPVLNLVSSYDNIRTTDEILTIEGKVEDYDYLSINDKNIEVEGDHTFKYDYKLKDGLNEIRLEAGDMAGNIAEYTISAEKYIPESNPAAYIRLALIVLVLIIGCIFAFKLIKKRINHSEIDDYMYMPETEKKKEREIDDFEEDYREKKSLLTKIKTLIEDVLTKNTNNSPLSGNEKNIVSGIKQYEKGEKNPKETDEFEFDMFSDDTDDANEKIKKKKKTEKSDETEMDRKIRKMKKSFTIGDILSIVIPIVVVVFIMNFVLLITNIKSGSMEPALKTGDFVVYNRLAYINNDINRGDVVAFYSDEFKELMGKRVIGIQGDTVEFRDGYVIINGSYVDETAYISDDIETNCTKTFEVPEGCVFLLGDNRENSNDARYWENPYIPVSKIKGLYMGRMGFEF